MAVDRTHLTRFALLSLLAALATITLKMVAWYITGSVGLLSDAMESIVNVVAAAATMWLLFLSARPPDDRYAYGYSKAEYFASAFEGALILVAAVAIGWAAIVRLLHPQPIEQVGMGIAVSIVATTINFVVARLLLRAARRHNSIALEADAHHLMTDVWTSVGVVVAVLAVGLTGWSWLDPVIALAVAVNIVFTGISLLRRSAFGLMDQALPPDSVRKIEAILAGIAAPKSSSTPSAPGPRPAARSSRCTCWCPAAGPCSKGTTSWNAWRARSRRPCRAPRCSRTWSRARIRRRTTT